MSTSVDDETILDVLRENDDPRMTTTEVAEELPVTRGTTRSRLQRLVDDARLERTREGNNVVWWLPDRAEELDASAAAADDEETGSDETDDGADTEQGSADEAEDETDEAAAREPADDVDEVETADDDADAEAEATATEDTETADEDDVDDGAAEIEVTATSDATDDGAATVEVEAVGGDDPEEAPQFGETVADDTDEAEPDLPELSDDEEGLRALAAVAVGLVVVLLVRRLLSGGDDA